MPSRCCEFVDSRLRRSPPDRASAVPYGQAGENAMRFPHLAHRSAAAHKLHSTPQQHAINLISGKGETSSRLPGPFSLFLPGSCPNNRNRCTDPRATSERASLPRDAEQTDDAGIGGHFDLTASVDWLRSAFGNTSHASRRNRFYSAWCLEQEHQIRCKN